MNHFLRNFIRAEFFYSRWFYLVSFVVILLLITGRHRLIDNFGCEICSDKAGYYMYLPATFHLGFTAENYPEGFDRTHGYGFRIEKKQNKIITKFPYGVAALLAPFYAGGAVISKLFSINADPYSTYYLFFVDIGAAFYCVLGFFFLRKWLEHYASRVVALTITLLTFLGTNLFYYSLDENLMGHLYSFVLFSGVLYGMKSYYITEKFRFFILFMLCLSFAIVIRPTNILFVIIAFLMNAGNFKTNLKLFFTLKNIIAGISVFFIILLPQLLYWRFAFGKYIAWSYEGEGFTNWNHPQLLVTWFSPQSGLFPYAPVILLTLLTALIMIFKKIPNGFTVLFTFLVVSYICAAWWNPFFGECNFGKRPFVEYLPVLMFPLIYLFRNFTLKKRSFRISVVVLFIFIIWYNQALFAAFNTCFPGKTWDWAVFLKLLLKGSTIIR